MIEAVQGFERNIDEFVLDSVREPSIEEFVKELNQQQLDNGVDSNGNIIMPLYTDTTIGFKIRKGQPFDRVTLKDTGAFHESFIVIYHRDSFQLTATDKKRRELQQKYGAAIFGLTDESLEALVIPLKVVMRNNLLKLLTGRTE